MKNHAHPTHAFRVFLSVQLVCKMYFIYTFYYIQAATNTLHFIFTKYLLMEACQKFKTAVCDLLLTATNKEMNITPGFSKNFAATGVDPPFPRALPDDGILPWKLLGEAFCRPTHNSALLSVTFGCCSGWNERSSSTACCTSTTTQDRYTIYNTHRMLVMDPHLALQLNHQICSNWTG